MSDEVLENGGPFFVQFSDLKREFGIHYCRVHVNRLIRKGLFPQSVLLGERRVAWRRQDLVQWINARPAAHAAPAEPVDNDPDGGAAHALQRLDGESADDFLTRLSGALKTVTDGLEAISDRMDAIEERRGRSAR